MSATMMMRLVAAQNVFDSPMQTSAMTLLCWYHSEKTGYATISYGRIARWCGVDRRYVLRLMERLELEKLACVNLGPDPEQGGRNRWQVTVERAVAKARREAGVGEDVPLARIQRRRMRSRRSTVVIPGPPPCDAVSSANPGHRHVRSVSAGLQTTPPMIQGPPAGDPGITGVVVPGSPQSTPGSETEVQVRKRTVADADASATSASLEFQLIGEARPLRPHDRAGTLAADQRRSRLYHHIVRQARWLLEHPLEAAALNAGAAITTESDLVFVTKECCRQKRIAGYGEGDVLAKACRSEWHLFGVRKALATPIESRPKSARRGQR